MSLFIRRHKTLSILFIVSIADIIWYILVSYLYTSNRIVTKLIDVIYGLALSYIASFIFYIIQVYLPESEKQKSIDICIYNYVERIVYEINVTVDNIAQKSLGHSSYNNPYTRHELSDLLEFDFDTKINVADMHGYTIGNNGILLPKYATVQSWLASQTAGIRNNIDEVTLLYGNYISPLIIKELENIKNTSVMSAWQPVYYGIFNIPYKYGTTEFLYEFYDAGQRLKAVCDCELKNKKNI